MSGLNTRQRASINGALAMINSAGADVAAVQRRAATVSATGRDTYTGYKVALNEFAKANPVLGGQLAKVATLIEASDDATAALYDRTLREYIRTGDETAVEALAPMMQADVAALAERGGGSGAAAVAEMFPDSPPQKFAFNVGPQTPAQQPSGNPGSPTPAALPTLSGAALRDRWSTQGGASSSRPLMDGPMAREGRAKPLGAPETPVAKLGTFTPGAEGGPTFAGKPV